LANLTRLQQFPSLGGQQQNQSEFATDTRTSTEGIYTAPESGHQQRVKCFKKWCPGWDLFFRPSNNCITCRSCVAGTARVAILAGAALPTVPYAAAFRPTSPPRCNPSHLNVECSPFGATRRYLLAGEGGIRTPTLPMGSVSYRKPFA
jgi:hypothetical protein